MHRSVETADGQRIAARFFQPEGEPKGAVLIVPAMGCSQDYYQHFGFFRSAYEISLWRAHLLPELS